MNSEQKSNVMAVFYTNTKRYFIELLGEEACSNFDFETLNRTANEDEILNRVSELNSLWSSAIEICVFEKFRDYAKEESEGESDETGIYKKNFINYVRENLCESMNFELEHSNYFAFYPFTKALVGFFYEHNYDVQDKQ
jgi:hypothetical protein